jgi:hypothetical protein
MARHRWTRWVIEASAGHVPLPWGRAHPPRTLGIRA